jgi:hypothetical protein
MHRTIPCVTMVLVGCSVPDDPNWDASIRLVNSLPPTVQVDAKIEVANRRAAGWWARKPPKDMAIEIHCTAEGSPTDPGLEQWALDALFSLSPIDVLACLAERPRLTYQGCLTRFEERVTAQLLEQTGQQYLCQAYTLPAYDDADDRKDWTAERVLTPDVVAALLRATAAPWWYVAALGAAGAASGAPIVALGPALCVQAGPDYWSCPSSPLYPPGATPQPEPPAGDAP